MDATISQGFANVLRAYAGGLIQVRECARDLEYAVMASCRQPKPQNGFAKKPSPFQIDARPLLDLAPGKLSVRRPLSAQLHFARSNDSFANGPRRFSVGCCN